MYKFSALWHEGLYKSSFWRKTNSGQTRKNILILKEDFEDKIKI